MSAWENLLYFGRLKGLRTGEIRPRAERLLRDLDLWDRRHEQVGSFSRGMQQKVAVAAALIADPPILLLDEPTLGLDVASARTFKDWIIELARDQKKTIVLTTHQFDVAQELADRIAVIRSGEIIADLPTAELRAQHAEDRYEIRLAGQREALDTGIAELRATGVRVLGVEPSLPSLEEVFLNLLREDAAKTDREVVR